MFFNSRLSEVWFSNHWHHQPLACLLKMQILSPYSRETISESLQMGPPFFSTMSTLVIMRKKV